MNDMDDLLRILAITVGAGVLLVTVVVALVMWRYRIPPRGLVAIGAALVYLVSPVDVLPEILLGPFGLVDDAGVLTATAVWVYKLIKVRQRLREGGVIDGPARRSAARSPADSPPASLSRRGRAEQ